MPRRPAGPRNESGGKKAEAQKARRRTGTAAKRNKKSAARKLHPRPKRSAGSVTVFAPEGFAGPADAAGHARRRSLDDVAGLSGRHLHEIYRCLFETRRLEEHLVALYRQNQVVGGVYRSLGQEATAVGCTYGLRNGDIIQPLIRDLGAALVHGATPLAMLRQYMARGTGPTGGRDLNTHFSDPSAGMLGPVSMLGAMVPALAGCLLAARMRGERKVGLCFIGDGGSSTGAFYEGINFAAVQRLPLIGVIEANHYAYSTPTEYQVPGGDLVRRARGFGVYVAHLDGNDVLACYEAVRDARARGLLGDGPTLLVADTYRRRGHAEHDNQAYVPDGEIDDWRVHNDPVDRYVRFLLEGGHATQAELDAIREAVEAELEEARTQAVSESFPDPATATAGVYDDGERPWPTTDTWFRGGPPHRESP
jgi:pyruvate dehydrogenase E1 component alpha subunit/2-oxoisovalerate dehydrogenase E1 component alpha subunit